MALRCTIVFSAAALCSSEWLGSHEAGKKFLKDNAQRADVITLPSGLQYKVLHQGTGQHHPTEDSPCKVHYVGTTLSRTPDAIDKKNEYHWDEFDSSYKREDPSTFAPKEARLHNMKHRRYSVIAGLTEAMQLMVEGDKWELYIPSDLGYGEQGSGRKVRAGEVLIFRFELLSINGGKVAADRCDPKSKKGCSELQTGYVEMQAGKSVEQLKSELELLEGMAAGGEAGPEIQDWLGERVKILTKMVNARDEL